METKFYVDGNGVYLGGFSGLSPEGGIEVPSAPDDACQVWNGSSWGFSKNDLCSYLSDYRWKKEVGGITTGGLLVRTDDRTKTLLIGKKDKAVSENNPTKLNKVKLPVGFIDLTNQQLIDMFYLVATHVQKCFDCEASVYNLIMNGSLTTKAEINTAFDNAYAA